VLHTLIGCVEGKLASAVGLGPGGFFHTSGQGKQHHFVACGRLVRGPVGYFAGDFGSE